MQGNYLSNKKHLETSWFSILNETKPKNCKSLFICINFRYTTSRTSQFYGLSLHDTIQRVLQLGDIKQAEKLKNEYKVPDKRYWWLRIQVLSETFQWDELEKFSKLKKSPIGYEPFVEVCLKQQNIIEAKKYLPKCRDDRKVKWYIRAG